MLHEGSGAVTVKVCPFPVCPPTITVTGPVVAPAGTIATMLLALQLLTTAGTPLNSTVLFPCDGQKSVPAIVMDLPEGPEAGVMLVTLGLTLVRRAKSAQD